MPYANTDAMSIFLKEVGKRHAGEQILMFMDQTGWHKAGNLKVPGNIKLAYLPPYSPDLNPQEQVWDELREKYFGNKLFKTLPGVINNAVRALRAIERVPEKIKSLTHRDWIFNPV